MRTVPLDKTDEAELMPAIAARHVVACPRMFDWCSTVRIQFDSALSAVRQYAAIDDPVLLRAASMFWLPELLASYTGLSVANCARGNTIVLVALPFLPVDELAAFRINAENADRLGREVLL